MSKRRNFEKFNTFMNDTFPRASLIEKSIAECVWDSRQNEIDALKCLNRNYSKIIDDQDSSLSAAPTPTIGEIPIVAPTRPDSGCGVTEEWELSPTPPEVEPIYQVRIKSESQWTDLASKVAFETYQSSDGLETRIVYTSPPSPQDGDTTRRDELLFENAELRGRLLKYEDPNKYMAMCSVMTGVITKEQCESWLKERGIASWDADGNPLNLEAAARDLVEWFSEAIPSSAFQASLDNVLKFLPEGES